MTQPTVNEPTLTDVINRLDRLDDDVKSLSTSVEKISSDSERFNDRFGNYQQATQWVVQLAFTLIASATLTVIITAVLKR